MKKNITIIDYGSGNILSAKQSFARVIKKNNIDADVCISGNLETIKNSTHIVLPGQGAFETCIKGLERVPGMIEELNNFGVVQKKPFFGICVGMQLLADNSEENGNHQGLGWIEGTIKKLPSTEIKLPHMGWNSIKIVNKNSEIKPAENDYYFVHSYYAKANDSSRELSTTDYGINFTSSVIKDNIFACQFHPEKSSANGLQLLSNFISYSESIE